MPSRPNPLSLSHDQMGVHPVGRAPRQVPDESPDPVRLALNVHLVVNPRRLGFGAGQDDPAGEDVLDDHGASRRAQGLIGALAELAGDAGAVSIFREFSSLFTDPFKQVCEH